MPDTPPQSPRDSFHPDIAGLMQDMETSQLMIEAIGAWFATSPGPVTRTQARRALEQLWTATLNRAVPVSALKPSERLGGKLDTAAPDDTAAPEQEPAND